jgi:hypothetical protein
MIEPQEHSEETVWTTILALFPDAIMSMDEDNATLCIDTGLVVGGKNGDILDGRFDTDSARWARRTRQETTGQAYKDEV